MSKKLEVPFHQTTDLVEAAALLTLPGCDVLDVAWADEKHVVWFLYRKPSANIKDEEVKAFLEELREGEALVEPYAFAKAMRKAKAAMYEFMEANRKTDKS